MSTTDPFQSHETFQSLERDELDRVIGGLSLPPSVAPDRAFDDGPLLTEALRQGMRGRSRAASPAPRRAPLQKSDTNPGWCDDGFGIVPCR